MDFSKEELLEARRQIDSTLHKLRETIKTFEANPAALLLKNPFRPPLIICSSQTYGAAYRWGYAAPFT